MVQFTLRGYKRNIEIKLLKWHNTQNLQTGFQHIEME